MRYLLLNMSVSFLLFVVTSTTYGQKLDDINYEAFIAIDFNKKLNGFIKGYDTSLYDYTDIPYAIELISMDIKNLSCGFNMSIEDEPEYNDGLNIIKEFAFLDYSLNYKYKDWTISMILSNILNFTDFAYAIEVDKIDNNFVFTHEQDSSIAVSLVFEF